MDDFSAFIRPVVGDLSKGAFFRFDADDGASSSSCPTADVRLPDGGVLVFGAAVDDFSA